MPGWRALAELRCHCPSLSRNSPSQQLPEASAGVPLQNRSNPLGLDRLLPRELQESLTHVGLARSAPALL